MTELAPNAASCATLGELLCVQARAPKRPWDIKLLYHQSELPEGVEPVGDDLAVNLSYAELLRYGQRAAAALSAAGVNSGDRVLLLLPTGVGWLTAFWGCQLLGAIPVPLIPPWSVDQLMMQGERIAEIARICGAAAVVIEPQLRRVLEATRSAAVEPLRALRQLTPSDLFSGDEKSLTLCLSNADDPAFIQFTSGSTAEPKGVVISQRAALANCDFIGTRLAVDEHDVGCSWLPLFHDMGLIGHILTPLRFRVPSVLLPPEVFARQPRTWFEVLTRYQATVTTAPNSAYDLCAGKISDRDIAQLDLSRLRIAMCGAEPILPATLRRFARRFAGVGFRELSFMPVYGLAEATLAVTLGVPDKAPRVERLDRRTLEEQRYAASLATAGEEDSLENGQDAKVEVVSVGRPIAPDSLRIVDDAGRPLPERQVGAIEAGGRSLMTEYFRNPSATSLTLKDGFVSTGDLGFMIDGELFVVGRTKEIIIKAGRTLHPYDIEAAAGSVEGIRKGRVVAFGVANAETGTEDVVVVGETKITEPKRRKQLEQAVKVAVFASAAVRIDVLQLVPPGVLLKTSSGKLRRTAVRERFQSGTLRAMRASWSTRAKAYLAARWSRWGE